MKNIKQLEECFLNNVLQFGAESVGSGLKDVDTSMLILPLIFPLSASRFLFNCTIFIVSRFVTFIFCPLPTIPLLFGISSVYIQIDSDTHPPSQVSLSLNSLF